MQSRQNSADIFNTYMNVYKIILCQRAHLLRHIWSGQSKALKKFRWFMFNFLKPQYTRLRYFCTFGESIKYNKKNKSFHEKMFWLSVYWRNPLISKCADKYRVREYIKECGCGDILNQLYGVYVSASEIDFSELPDSFVLKDNRGSGNNLFITDKNNCSEEDIINIVRSWENSVYGFETAEYQYAKIPFRIIAEKYLIEKDSDELVEYQLFCFNGIPDSILVRNDLETTGKNPFAVTYSLNWERLHYRINEDEFDVSLPRPANLDKMIEYAKRLSKPFPHVRVDFYEVSGKLVLGEMTFSTHGNVFSNYKPEVLEMWNEKFFLPKKNRFRNGFNR